MLWHVSKLDQSRYGIKRALRLKYGIRPHTPHCCESTERLLTLIKLVTMHTRIYTCYLKVFIVILTASSCFCYAGYDLFQGFNVTYVEDTANITANTFVDSTSDNATGLSYDTKNPGENTGTLSTMIAGQDGNVTNTTKTITAIPKSLNESLPTRYEELIETTALTAAAFDCPEDEKPSNIGPYEIPTQRDLLLFTWNIVTDMFYSYNKEALYLLKDIRAATKATSSIEKKCLGNKLAFKQCVKRVSNQCQQYTKELVKSLEKQKEEFAESIDKGKICNLLEMKVDLIKLLKSLSQEKISVEFALPGFLRLLSACSANCIQSASESYKSKPTRHMTDQDLVVKHFLTRKNYVELIMDPRRKPAANSN